MMIKGRGGRSFSKSTFVYRLSEGNFVGAVIVPECSQSSDISNVFK